MESSYLFINGIRLRYLHWNLDGGDRPIVLLHGLASNARIWELAAPYLAQNGVLPLALDQRGHGLTDGPDGDYGFETFARDLTACLDTLNVERPLLVGHSWGAMVALDYAARFSFGPHAPAGLVLVDGGMTQMDDRPGATWEETRQRLTPPSLAGMPLSGFLAHLDDPQRKWHPDERMISIILANFEIAEEGPADRSTEPVEVIYPHLSFEHHMQIVRALWEFKTYERFQRVRCPVLMVPAIPPEPLTPHERAFLASKRRGVARAQEWIGDLQVHWMPETIHDIPLQHPGELANLIHTFAASLP